MKIAIVCFYLNAPGGTQRQIFSLANELQRKGHKVKIVTAEFKKEFFPRLHDGLDIQVIPADFPRSVLFNASNIFQTIIKKLRRDRVFVDLAKTMADTLDSDFDVVNSHDYDSYRVGYFYKKRNPAARHVWMMNEIPFSYAPKANKVLELLRRIYMVYLRIAEKKYFKSIDAVAALNEFDAKWIRGAFHIPAELVESGCDGKKFYAPLHPPRSGDPIILLGMGICAPYRRFEDIIKAAAILRADNRNVEVNIVGTNGNPSDPYPQMLIDLASKERIADKVRFDFKSITDEKLCAYYKSAHVFVFPTYVGAPRNGYGWGLAAFEAMSAGLPVVLCRTTASVRLMHDGADALLVDPCSPKNIADQVTKLIVSDEYYRTLAATGQTLALEQVTWDRYAQKMVGLFTGVKGS